jgi:hypothetical protein
MNTQTFLYNTNPKPNPFFTNPLSAEPPAPKPPAPNPPDPNPPGGPNPPNPVEHPAIAGHRWTRVNPRERVLWRVEAQCPDGTWAAYPSALVTLVLKAGMRNVAASAQTVEWRAPNCDVEFRARYEQPGWLVESREPYGTQWTMCRDLGAVMTTEIVPPPDPLDWI